MGRKSSTSKKQRIGGVETSRPPRVLRRSTNGKDQRKIFRRQVYKLRGNEFHDQINEKDAIVGQRDGLILGMREEGNRSSGSAQIAKSTRIENITVSFKD